MTRAIKRELALSRRSAIGLGGAALLIGSGTSAEAVGAQPSFGTPPVGSSPSLVWEFDMRLTWDGGRHSTGTYSSGQRIYNVVADGQFSGPRLKGKILPGGGDWALLNPPDAPLQGASPRDRHFQFDARYILLTDDGVHIYVFNRGGKTIAGGPLAHPRRAVTTPLFDVPIGSNYAFLADNSFVALSEAHPTETVMSVFRIVAN